MTAFTLGTRTFSKVTGLTGNATPMSVPAVFYKGAHWNDVPAGEDGQALVDSLNAQENATAMINLGNAIMDVVNNDLTPQARAAEVVISNMMMDDAQCDTVEFAVAVAKAAGIRAQTESMVAQANRYYEAARGGADPVADAG